MGGGRFTYVNAKCGSPFFLFVCWPAKRDRKLAEINKQEAGAGSNKFQCVGVRTSVTVEIFVVFE